MKKYVLILIGILTLISVGCDLLAPTNKEFNNESIIPVEGQDGYYTDSTLVLCTEIRGSYKSNRPFTLDEENENLRIWDNIYLYEYDYFQMIELDGANIFYSVTEDSLEYVTIEDRLAYATINEEKSGLYRIIFDLTTKLFTLEYKSEIINPVFEKMDGCDVYSLKSEFTPMIVNPNNPEELMIENYQIDADTLISFHNHGDVHLSNYKVILDSACQGKYASAIEDGDKHVSFAIGGIYNLYINPVTYLLRAELTNPDTASYSLQVYEDGEPRSLEAENPNTPYIFKYQMSIEKRTSIPLFISNGYLIYELIVLESEYVDSIDRIENPGTYELEINLKTFTISVTQISN